MNSRLPLVLACLLFAPTLARAAQEAVPERAREGQPLNVMTFNIRNGLAADGDDHWLKRKDNVVATIQDQGPHLLGLQEAYDFQVDYLAEQLHGYHVVGVGREGGRRGEYSCLFIDRRRFEVVRSGTFWLSEKPTEVGSRSWDSALPRICTWTVLRDRTNGREFVWMNTHFDHRGKVARERSAALMQARLAEFVDLPAIVTGDLNAGEDSPPLKALKGTTLRDSFRVLHQDEEEVGTFSGFSGQLGGAKIDYVLCSSEWTVLEASIDRRRFAGRNPSDHYPVLAKLRL